ncbi:hypothetical protein KC360_g32 [Hortaea werneckii]|nr:hypothetical protein KC325_g335 [Hortaea werneckii]KAI7001822.1 hypothetical protein KC359_g371 [Hortaea werneckii]KAI7150406.1 hypothetical protein KC344_g30 [Hortaea werneckii]KAI7180509.1 hypothetical protein KC360_g32 [Hortaea werneckii]
MSMYLDEVAHLLVTDENPPREIDGLDHERCAALQNAMLKHAWVRSGRNEETFVEGTVPFIETCGLERPEENLHPSVVEFYRKARTPCDGMPGKDFVHFFYNLRALTCSLEDHEYCFDDGDDDTITLYDSTSQFTKPDGLVYDQGSHSAILHLDIQDELDVDQPWQYLESILSVWIEMIQRQKVAAISNEAGSERFEQHEQGWLVFHGPDRDPLTGLQRYTQDTEPWTIVPWTAKDLEEALEVWESAVETVEEKMELDDAETTNGLLNAACLDAVKVPDGFAREFLAKARRPRFEFIAPGFKVPDAEHFTRQPFTGIPTEADTIPPILLFRGEQTVPTEGIWWFGRFSNKYNHTLPDAPSSHDVPECPSGLYFSMCHRTHGHPEENGCNLVLPFDFENGFAKKSDGMPAEKSFDLLQAGTNPFNDNHPLAITAFLETVRENVENGHWPVDEHGVSGGLDVWKQADTEEHWDKYFQPLGPGMFW